MSLLSVLTPNRYIPLLHFQLLVPLHWCKASRELDHVCSQAVCETADFLLRPCQAGDLRLVVLRGLVSVWPVQGLSLLQEVDLVVFAVVVVEAAAVTSVWVEDRHWAGPGTVASDGTVGHARA